MTPLGGALAGMAVVALDLRVNGFDLLADPVGWVMVALFVGRLAGLDPWFKVAVAASWIGAVASLTNTVEVNQDPLWQLGEPILQAVVLFAMCSGMIERLDPGDPAIGQLGLIRWVDLGATLLVLTLAPLTRDAAAPLVVIGGLALLVTAIGFLVVTLGLRSAPVFSGVTSAAPA